VSGGPGDGLLDALVIAVGGALGAIARYLVSRVAVARLGAHFPFGTLFVNVSGSLVLGYVGTVAARQWGAAPLLTLFLTTGFTGGYTTFSTYSYEAALLIRQGAARMALIYLLANVLGGMLAGAAGILLAGGL
jgi:CrcB protein